MIVLTLPLTTRDIEEIEGIAALGMPIGGTLVGRLCADWRRLTAERDGALAALPPADTLWNAALLLRDYGSGAAVGMACDLERRSDRIRALDPAPAPVPAADVPDVPAFLAHRVNGGRS